MLASLCWSVGAACKFDATGFVVVASMVLSPVLVSAGFLVRFLRAEVMTSVTIKLRKIEAKTATAND